MKWMDCLNLNFFSLSKIAYGQWAITLLWDFPKKKKSIIIMNYTKSLTFYNS